ncbi:MAG: outer membrane beta-barrel protein [Pseudomonadota bacterium]|nr:outer membrane beta-barrel protein [Pseudomonadota bacterium]
MTMLFRPAAILLLLIFSFFLLPGAARSADFSWEPAISIKGEYDDNITFDNQDETDDYLATISPSLTFKYASERLTINNRMGADILRYNDETDLDDEYLRCNLDGEYLLTEKFSLTGRGSYIKDTTLESELEETGLVNYREDRRRYSLGGGFGYRLSEVSNCQLDYGFGQTNYDGYLNLDYDFQSVTGTFQHQLANMRDVIILQPYYYYYDSDVSQVDNYGLSLGFEHPFSETLNLSMFAGVRYTESSYDQQEIRYILIPPGILVPVLVTRTENDDNWGGVADISLKKTAERWTVELGYNRDLSYGSSGESIERDRFHFTAGYEITARWRARLSTSLSYSESDSDFSDEDSRYFNLTPSISYKLTEQHSLVLTYSYAEVYDKILTSNQRYDRNRIWLSLNFRFPQP